VNTVLDPLINSIQVKDQVGFDPNTLLPLRNKVVTFRVGTQGPFTLAYTYDRYSAAQMEKDINAEVETLRKIGAVT
jgi:hypothetical protein